MKKVPFYFLFLFSILLFSACENETQNTPESDQQISQERTYPRIPQANLLNAIVESETPDLPQIPQNKRPQNANLDDQLLITKGEIEQGWYTGVKRVGTPDSWVQKEKDGELTWMSQPFAQRMEEDRVVAICQATGGEYLFSCSETSRQDCHHNESQCICPNDLTRDYPGDAEGCLLYDQENEKFPMITQQERERGFYTGPKKLGTPTNWVYFPGEPNPKSIKDEAGWRNADIK